MSVSPRMTLNEVMEHMRCHGMSIGADVLSTCLENGVFPFAHVIGKGPTGRTCFLIMRKDYEQWAKEYLLPYANT